MKKCRCCISKSQLDEKMKAELVLIQEWLKNVHAHAQGLSTNKSVSKKICIDIELDRIDDLITSIVNNGKYKKFSAPCNNGDIEA